MLIAQAIRSRKGEAALVGLISLARPIGFVYEYASPRRGLSRPMLSGAPCVCVLGVSTEQRLVIA